MSHVANPPLAGTDLSMGRVTVSITLENLSDLSLVHEGHLAAADVRRLVVENALVDTGATFLSLPTSMIAQLGLVCHGERKAMTADGPKFRRRFSAVRLTIFDRDCVVEVAEVPDGVPALVGQIPLEALDLVVDCPGQRLIGNPAHNGEFMMEQY